MTTYTAEVGGRTRFTPSALRDSGRFRRGTFVVTLPLADRARSSVASSRQSRAIAVFVQMTNRLARSATRDDIFTAWALLAGSRRVELAHDTRSRPRPGTGWRMTPEHNPSDGPPDGPPDGRAPVVIERVEPTVDDGRFAAKCVAGDPVVVRADVFTHGQDHVAAVARHRPHGAAGWAEEPMTTLGNDRWEATFEVGGPGRHEFTIVAWPDEFATWKDAYERKVAAGQDVSLDAEVGARLAEEAAKRAGRGDATRLQHAAERLRGARRRVDLEQLAALVAKYPDRSHATEHDRVLPVVVDRAKAACSAWYELFPRSASPDPRRPGTFTDCIEWLPYLAELGFDVLYLPPIHPIGTTNRKGRNNALVPAAGDVGSPWAIGSPAGGHTAIDPGLGTLADFRRLVRTAATYDLEVAIDLAFQCSPDHPWVVEHPAWFRHRPDGSIQYAENPPKRYEDIYPLDFATEDWRALWEALLGVVEHWVEQGVRIFRVDNPHTKPFAFWEWLIARIRANHPDVLFLSEAFTRPAVMHRLAKVGFSQSYTYFTWRTAKHELTEYFTELTRGPGRYYFRPNVWPNTPDILHEYLQTGGPPAFTVRLILAAFLSANYGIYGPAFELMEHEPMAPGNEEYLHSEKYEARHWELDRPDSLRHVIARVNRIRREHPALQRDDHLRFHGVDNDQLMCWSKRTDAGDDVVLVVVNLDPHHSQAGITGLDLGELGLAHDESFEAHDLLTGARYRWHGPHNYVELDPYDAPAHVLTVGVPSEVPPRVLDW
jgi:starch synthase (maltosyl-transferring)